MTSTGIMTSTEQLSDYLAETEVIVTTVGRYTVTVDPECEVNDTYPASVYDDEFDFCEGFNCLADALRYARESESERAAEERADRISDLQSDCEALIAECEDEALLERIKALLSAVAV